ncbi:MAG: cobalamin B12-binding domain-containing protein [Theionarchaea archaeon]|nr:cobalamin B12-binding domain-containing protein [Theionarchaea archaeon]MBU6999970.1 cobalamin B12-binding domain-containing protein [Theionarchaea archaeon]MBU7022318.1 cobalamin B12-binding domain-containing protein [Theionarchaea archaeon]MBU7035074.1 cobalamin B12-binding domain-containing protein [Theionarchaea archaeon]MBU7040650.1 cobalamin B12-binding domain-containing protein [Theionarchaea archaeon]
MHYDMLFIHPSAHPDSPQFIVMPMGVVSLMNELEGYDVEAINVGLELCLDRNFDIEEALTQCEYDCVGIDLHWHEHSFTALQVAEICKKVHPGCKVILGGLTASYFAQEIMHSFEHVDYVVRGEGEQALPLLLRGDEAELIPNLVYRDNGTVKETPVSPVECLDSLDFSTISGIRHWEDYLKSSIHGHMRRRFWYDFWLCTGRGCSYDCSYCGGAHHSQNRLCARHGMTFRSVDAVMKDLVHLQDLGVHVVCPSHDISLAGPQYWGDLFRCMKEAGISMGMYLEVWQLPDTAFLEALADICNPRFTTIVMTPLSGNESIRELNGKHFANEDFYDRVKYTEDVGMNHAPYFATGLPFETRKTFKETLTMTEVLITDFNPSAIFCTPLRLDPGSPMFENPDHYKIVKHFHTFRDYYERCMKRAQNLPHDFIGYHTENLDGRTIMEMQNEWEALLRENPVMAGTSMDTLHFV